MHRLVQSWTRFRRLAGDMAARLLRWLRQGGGVLPRRGRLQLPLENGELAAVAAQIEAHPWMGGKKGAANLVHAEATWMGAGSYGEVRQAMVESVEQELKARRAARPPTPFDMPRAEALNEVWASDLAEIQAWGSRFDLGYFLDVFNLEYLSLDACPHAADSAFVVGLFEEAAAVRGGSAPTVCTKTDRGGQYRADAFKQALEGRTRHVKIPPGCPWFNGEAERGNQDLKAVLYGLIASSRRPEPGQELATLRHLCGQAREVLNDQISRPRLGNVTPREIAQGVADAVRERNRAFVARKKEERKQVPAEAACPWLPRLVAWLDLGSWSTARLKSFLARFRRDYVRLST